jgi:hypothetical protein
MLIEIVLLEVNFMFIKKRIEFLYPKRVIAKRPNTYKINEKAPYNKINNG